MIKNIILAIVLLCQLTIWFLVDPPWAKAKAKSEPVTAHTLDDLAMDRVGAFEVSDAAGQNLRLSLRDGVWCIDNLGGFPANQEKVTKALAELDGLSKSDFRTDKTFLHEDLQVDDRKAQTVKVFTAKNEPLLHLLIGKRDIQGARGTFIRRAGEAHVFVSRSQTLGSVFSTVPTAWYENSMMDVSLRDAQRLTDLGTSCFRLELEVKSPKGGGPVPLVVKETEDHRYVYEKVTEKKDDGTDDVYWRVIEPSGMEELQLDDKLVKSMATAILRTQSSRIVGLVKPEHGLSDPDERIVRAVARFKEGDVETSQVLEIGVPVPAADPTKPVTVKPNHFARVSHPGDKMRQKFVFEINGAWPGYFYRKPEMFKRQPTPPPTAPK